MSTTLEFSNAPVIEVILGSQFEGVTFESKSIFDFYNSVKENFPDIQENPPLAALIENIDSPSETRIISGFTSRKFFINNSQNKLIQIQPDRFLFNWRKTNNEEEYPHFDSVFSEFIGIFNQLEDKISIKSKLNQLEMTYVDHILLEDFNMSNFNPNKILNIFNLSKNIKNINSSFHFPIKEIKGNMICNIKSAFRNIDKKRLIIIESTCRGINDNQTIDQWFDIAHKNLIELFKEITTKEAKLKWGLKS